MNVIDRQQHEPARAIVVGAGFGGLSAALLLSAAGLRVTLIEQHSWIGGKARNIASSAGPVAAGPTVLTMRHVFDELFADTGARLADLVQLSPEPILARHFWPDGSTLDLTTDRETNIQAVTRFAGPKAGKEFRAFAEEAEALFTLFDAPMMQAAEPLLSDLARSALSAPQHLPTLLPHNTLARKLRRSFSDPRLRQLFGRYATYVGGDPEQAPAILSLIWRAEEAGVWRVTGGLHSLAEAMRDRLRAMGGEIRLGTGVKHLMISENQINGVTLEDGTELRADRVVFNGDPRALALGKLGPEAQKIAPQTAKTRRSLSARVWSFAAKPSGPDLAHHNVFFAQTLNSEFDAIRKGQFPEDPTLYVCAADRGTDLPPNDSNERFQIILNAASLADAPPMNNEVETCRQVTFQALARFGLTFSPEPQANALATPTTFGTLFPGSAGALYGQSPHGPTAALKRPRARTTIRGLYLAGGGTHPGAGVPMAALSGRHAAEAIMTDLVLT